MLCKEGREQLLSLQPHRQQVQNLDFVQLASDHLQKHHPLSIPSAPRIPVNTEIR